MTTTEITLRNYRFQPTGALEAKLEDLSELDCEDGDELAEAIEAELDGRELEENLPSYDDSLDDRGVVLGSYAS